MRLCKFKLVTFLILILAVSRVAAFDDNNCLKANYDVEISHKGQPFGMLPVILKLNKTGCIISISHKKLKYIKKNWEVDVCREPVHIKQGLGAVEVVKKQGPCPKSDGAFCSQIVEMKKLIQDDGLIFAPGEKENLQSDHGKVYCSYLLLNKYLTESLVFSRDKNYEGVLTGARQVRAEKVVEPTGSSEESPVLEESAPSAPRPEIVGEEAQAPAPEQGTDNKEVNEKEKEDPGKGFF